MGSYLTFAEMVDWKDPKGWLSLHIMKYIICRISFNTYIKNIKIVSYTRTIFYV